MDAKSLLACAAAFACHCAVAQPVSVWDFIVRLDGEPVGTHRFRLTEEGPDSRVLTSEARFDVKVLGIPVYRYRHAARERWTGGCLAEIEATTDDGGQRTEVRGRQTAGGFALSQGAPIPGCVMSFAYWNPQLPSQRQLLDPGTGRVVPVRIERAGPARRWRITGLPNPIDIEWDDERWISLETVVSGRRLTYHLK